VSGNLGVTKLIYSDFLWNWWIWCQVYLPTCLYTQWCI